MFVYLIILDRLLSTSHLKWLGLVCRKNKLWLWINFSHFPHANFREILFVFWKKKLSFLMLSTGVSYIIFLTRKTDKYKIKLNNNNKKRQSFYLFECDSLRFLLGMHKIVFICNVSQLILFREIRWSRRLLQVQNALFPRCFSCFYSTNALEKMFRLPNPRQLLMSTKKGGPRRWNLLATAGCRLSFNPEFMAQLLQMTKYVELLIYNQITLLRGKRN